MAEMAPREAKLRQAAAVLESEAARVAQLKAQLQDHTNELQQKEAVLTQVPRAVFVRLDGLALLYFIH